MYKKLPKINIRQNITKYTQKQKLIKFEILCGFLSQLKKNKKSGGLKNFKNTNKIQQK